jgi:putative hemin transport protein
MIETRKRETNLRRRLATMRAAERRLRLRDAARRLGASEAEVIAAFCGGSVIRLQPAWRDILASLPALGEVMALTRNDHAVIEKVGTFGSIEIQGQAGLVLGEEIDLRLFLDRWHHGFALHDDGEIGLRRSLQFFDSAGRAVHKVFLTESSDGDAFTQLVLRFAAREQAPHLVAAAPTPLDSERPDGEIDVEGLRAGWIAMQDTHDFVSLLRRFGVARTQALRLAGSEWAEPLPVSSLRVVLESVAASRLPIMVFVGNHGAIEIHTGPVERVRPTGRWINVLDDGFNLHVHEPGLSAAWAVRKPTVDGIVTSVEFYDVAGEVVVLLFGKRKPGQPELSGWRQLVSTLPRR